MSPEFLYALAIGGTLTGWVAGFLCGVHSERRAQERHFKQQLDENVEITTEAIRKLRKATEAIRKLRKEGPRICPECGQGAQHCEVDITTIEWECPAHHTWKTEIC